MQIPARERIEAHILDRLNRHDAPVQVRALNAFFELSLEYASLRDFKSLCVLIPDVCLHVPASLYLRGRRGTLILHRSTFFREEDDPEAATLCLDRDRLFRLEHAGIFPIYGEAEPKLLGALRLHRVLSPDEADFFSGYARRVGRIMALRQAALGNRRSLTFIARLMRDIGHNIIVPNMQFKLLFLRMERKLREVEDKVDALAPTRPDAPDLSTRRSLPLLLRDLHNQLDVIARRFQQSSLFLESLLRREHFEKGSYQLRLRVCPVGEQIFEPQLERFRPLLRDAGIEIVRFRPEAADIPVEADIGLLAQVFANLLANAVKYTQTTSGPGGVPNRTLRYGWEISDQPPDGSRGIVRIFVSTSGPPIAPQDIPHLFDARFRASTAAAAAGFGHGLFFARQIVELHKGKISYNYADQMNTFCIDLPALPENSAPAND